MSFVWFGLLLAAASSGWTQSIVYTKHNLSAQGPGELKAISESRVCIFCHTPHQAVGDAPLWNRYSSGAHYVPYNSSTAKATIGQPTGSSKLCLSCHDGTVALGMVRSQAEPIALQSGMNVLGSGGANLATDLSDDHPVSFIYDPALAALNGQLRHPGTLTGPVHLEEGQMQCSSCHDPHNDQYGKFLVQHNTASALCLNCHEPTGWTGSSHATSSATWNGAGRDPWPHSEEITVADNACANCHRSHAAGSPARLLNFAGEEQNCFSCHNGNVSTKNIEREFNKLSVHPVTTFTGIHDPMEDLINAPRHVECVDCHNPHAATENPATPPLASGALAGLPGIDLAGNPVNPISFEYELCFRCHADSVRGGRAVVPRQLVQLNTRLEFLPSNASFHPVASSGVASSVPSLKSEYTTSSLIYCTDCHNNNQGPGVDGAGPAGPHGSSYRPILERQLLVADFYPESSGNYALCYKCHARDSILANQSFSLHSKHIVDARTACTTCHDPHGTIDTPHLINFNVAYVTASSSGRLEYVEEGPGQGRCYLSCHGSDHNPKSYPVENALLGP